mmetsp:Transcript_9927/g.12867  ORF Transcript_9927/g.12867 Transcript_9927/m.12867 type:complete len:89 (-) Transcript_9927:786-1052(-)
MWSDVVHSGTGILGGWDVDGRERIFSLIEDFDIVGVMLASGGSHGSRVFTVPGPFGLIYEFESANKNLPDKWLFLTLFFRVDQGSMGI